MRYNNNTIDYSKYLEKPLGVFSFFWLVTFILYIPAAKTGMDGDFPYWVLTIQNDTFLDFINTKGSALPILYQFSQFAKYIFYQVFGLNPWLWHLLHVTLQAIAAVLLFNISRNIFLQSGFKKPVSIAFFGVLLFCITPHSNEVIVREICYHYLQGFIFILLIMWCLLRYLNTQKVKYGWWAGVVYFLSTFSLEIFYLTPWLTLAIITYYRYVLHYWKPVCKKSIFIFFTLQLLLFVFNLILVRLLWGNRLAHIDTFSFSDPVSLFNKPILYFFHILFFGRYFPADVKMKVYSFFSSGTVIAVFYAIVVLLVVLFFLFFRKIPTKLKTIFLYSFFAVSFVFLAIPLDFAPILRVIGDRYIYIPSAFTSLIFVLAVSTIRSGFLAIIVYSGYFLANIYFAFKTNKMHYYATAITQELLTALPDAGDKKILLLNLPSNMCGALMIRAQPESEFKIMNNLFCDENKITNEVYDVCAYNMSGKDDGAHVKVINDSMIQVTLNQWGTWWWYGDIGAASYENAEYKVNMTDPGHWYELTLKKPASEYLILYQIGSQWKTVDWSKKNTDQN